MTSRQLKQLLTDYPNFRPTAGRSVIHLERKPEMEGEIVIPETARDLNVETARDVAYFGTVVKTTPRRDFQEEFQAGDSVWVMLLKSDLGEEYILTENTRVYARQTT